MSLYGAKQEYTEEEIKQFQAITKLMTMPNYQQAAAEGRAAAYLVECVGKTAWYPPAEINAFLRRFAMYRKSEVQRETEENVCEGDVQQEYTEKEIKQFQVITQLIAKPNYKQAQAKGQVVAGAYLAACVNKLGWYPPDEIAPFLRRFAIYIKSEAQREREELARTRESIAQEEASIAQEKASIAQEKASIDQRKLEAAQRKEMIARRAEELANDFRSLQAQKQQIEETKAEVTRLRQRHAEVLREKARLDEDIQAGYDHLDATARKFAHLGSVKYSVSGK